MQHSQGRAMLIFRSIRWVVTFALIFACYGAVAQQLANGFLFGVVRSDGDPLPRAKVTVEKIDTGMTHTVFASATGVYRVPRLPGGVYDVLVSTADLKYLLQTVVVTIGQGTRRDFEMSESDIGVHSQRARAEREDILVSAPPQPDIQGTFGEIHSVYSADEISQLPIPRDINAVVNMAPGTVIGHSRYSSNRNPLTRIRTTEFGLISIHGASISENVYYIDGMNVSNLSNGLGASVLPFEFYDQVQMVTGGLRAEFGRTTGGMVNAVTKSGTNEWHVRLGYYSEPRSLRGKLSDVTDANPRSRFLSSFSFDERESQEGFVSIAGPIIRNKLFVYSIFEDNQTEVKNYEAGPGTIGSLYVDTNNDPFLGLKFTYSITQNHDFNLTYFSDENTIKRNSYGWDEVSGEITGFRDSVDINRGGDNYIARYTGNINDKLSISILSGRNSYEYTNQNDADANCPVAIDLRDSSTSSEIGCWVNYIRSYGNDNRKVLRFDGEYVLSDAHLLRFGIDHENNTTIDVRGLSGPSFDRYRYRTVDPGSVLDNGGIVPSGVTEIVEHTIYREGGKFGATNLSFYIEDEWLFNESINVRLGLRYEGFTIENSQGATFLRMNDQWAPRVAVAWDLGDEERNRGILVGSFSRYHLPLATSVSRYFARPRHYSVNWHTLEGEISTDGSVELGTSIGPSFVYADGEIRPSTQLIDASIEPAFQDEFTLGYARQFQADVTAGVDYTFRRLGRVIEDIAIAPFLEIRPRRYDFRYVLTNPGTDLTVDTDTDGDGTVETFKLPVSEHRFPKPVRKYHAVEFYVDKHMESRLYLRGSYTWSHSYGNHEGVTRTDLGYASTLASITTQWDFLGLLDGAYGDLPNDRRHTIKLFGAWKIRENLQCSFAWGWQDGRPRNALGRHPTDRFARLYGSSSFFDRGELSPRGALGRTEGVSSLDIGLRYRHETKRGGVTATIDVFNLLDGEAVVDYNDRSDRWRGGPNPNFGAPAWYQNPRSIRFGLIYDMKPWGT